MNADLQKARQTFSKFPVPWFVCGGQALSLYIGQELRTHGDLDLGIFRKDQALLYRHFGEGYFSYVHGGQKKPWDGSFLHLPVHEIYVQQDNTQFEILMNETDGKNWIYRRNPKVTLPLPQAIFARDGIPFLAPEIVLLFKSKHGRIKDQEDYAAIFPQMTEKQRNWLDWALSQGHEG